MQSQVTCPDLILLDWKLPKMHADELLVALRTACPCALVIVLSGLPEDREPALIAGADGFVGKYELPEQLLAAIARCDGGRAACCTNRTGEQEEDASC
jgi:DNA-binding response OmpR family regulator